MFRFFLIIYFSFCCLSPALASDAQDVDNIVQSFKTSMGNKDAQSISSLLDNSVELTYSNLHSTYSRGQALLILDDFYNKNHPSSFKVEYKGVSSQSDGHYVLGTANTQNGPFKIFLYIKKKGNRFVIQEMKIDK